MVTAAIIINQIGKPAGSPNVSRDDLDLLTVTTLSSQFTDPTYTYKWELLSRPPGSTAYIDDNSLDTANIKYLLPVPGNGLDIVGSYIIKLTVDDGTSDAHSQLIAAVKTQYLDIRVPAAGESTEFNIINGWAQGIHSGFLEIDSVVGTHINNISNPHNTSIANLGNGTLAQLNLKISDANLDDSGASRPPSGSATGDLSGSYPNPTVDGLQGRSVASDMPVDGYALVWNNALSQWEPGEVSTTTSFIALTDTPGSYIGQGGKFVYVDSGESSLNFVDINLDAYATKLLLDGYATPDIVDGYAKNFTDLGDTPSSYAGQAGKAIIVKSGENGLEFGIGGGAGNLQQAYNGGRIIDAYKGPVEIDAYGKEALNLDGYLGIADGYDPEPLGNKGLIYVKEYDSAKHLFYMDNNGTSYQLTAQGKGLETVVDDTFKGASGIPVMPFPGALILGVTIDVAQGEDVIVSFAGSADPGATVNPYENIYCRLEVDSSPIYTNKITVVPIITGTEASDISFSYLLKNLSAGTRSITVSIDTGTAPGDPAGGASANNVVLGAARVLSAANVTLQRAYQNGRFMYVQQPIVIDAYGNEAFNIDGYVGFEPITAPEKLGDKGLVYVSDIDGYSELFYLDDYGKASQITSKGSLNTAAVTLDQAYEGGRIVNVDSGPVLMYVSGDTSGLSIESSGSLDGNPILETQVNSEANVQIGVWHQLNSDGYYEPRGVISDMNISLPTGGNYTAVGITSDLRPYPSNPSDTTMSAFQAGVHGLDVPRQGTYIAYDARSLNASIVQFHYALYADVGSVALDSGDLILRDGYIYLGEQSGDPGFEEDVGFVYTKDIGGYTELFYMDNYGSVAQITDDGYLNASTSLDSAYDGRAGSGAGREIIADSGAVIIDASGGHALGIDGYISLTEISDPINIADVGFVYAKDVDGYTELFFMDNYGSTTQITDDGYLAGTSKSAQDNLDSTGTETNIDLTYTPLSSLDTDSGRDLQVYRNGILMRWIAILGADPNRWTYNSSLNRIEFVASGTSDWYTAIYNRR